MEQIEGLDIEHKLYTVNSDVFCVFLPSGRFPHSISIYPRLAWRKKIPEFDTLFLADPFQNADIYNEIGGSWFIDPQGNSALPSLAEVLKKHILRSGYRKTIFYGSSMGGYAAIILAGLIENSHAIAECPQLFLENWPPSHRIISQLCTPAKKDALPNVVSTLLENTSSSSFTIVVNAFDHHHVRDHILPVMDRLLEKQEKYTSRVNFLFYINDIYPRDHSALYINDSINLILDAALQEKLPEAVSGAVSAAFRITQLNSEVARLVSQTAYLTSRLEEIEASKFTKLARLYYRLVQSPLFRPIHRLFQSRRPKTPLGLDASSAGEKLDISE
jgi:hypothetical protein